MDPLTLLAIAWFLGRGDKPKPAEKPRTKPAAKPGTPAASSPAKPVAAPAAPAASSPPKPAAERPPIAILPPAPPSKLLARANQQRAKDWVPALVKAGVPADRAQALGRWIGIESSGNPLALSPIGERGLLQSTKTTALKDKLFTPAEWEELQSPATTRDRHAQLARKQLAFHIARAKRWVSNPPPDNAIDWLFYAKMNHTRPLDLKEGKVHGPALQMSRDLATRWAGDAKRLHRLAVANVIAFGKVAP